MPYPHHSHKSNSRIAVSTFPHPYFRLIPFAFLSQGFDINCQNLTMTEKHLPLALEPTPKQDDRKLHRKKQFMVLVAFVVYLMVYLNKYITIGAKTAANGFDYKAVYLGALESNFASNWSKVYTSEPHLAGTNMGLVNYTRDKFEEYGLEATIDQYEILVSYPKDHDLNLLEDGKLIYKAPLKEDVIEEDETTSGDDLVPTFLGYAANGNVTAEYVYVNYGTKEDFEKLKALGVDVTGKIAVVRYGKIFRGLKVKFAQDNGAVGVLIYSDPGDDGEITVENGYEAYPNGPARQESSVQRGSVQFLGAIGAYPGDPTTPGYASKPGCDRVDPHKAIGKIPALPISIREVKPILAKLNGHGVKLTDDDWVGKLEGFDYYTGPSKKNELNLYNNQDFNISTLSNVYGEFKGEYDNEVILIGNHRDAWIKGGAGDPNSGSATILEMARALGELKAQGYKFKRTIRFASWDGEEYGLLGSTEYGEYASHHLKKNVVAYLNLDVAVEGDQLTLAGVPSLLNVVKKAASALQYPKKDETLWEHYVAKHGEFIRHLGSGSDYTVFLEHLGIPSLDSGFSSGKDSPIYHYHSNYDSYHWMEKYGDKDFVFHNLMAKFYGLIALELSEREVFDFKLGTYADYLIEYFKKVQENIPDTWLTEKVTNQDTWNKFLTISLDDAKYIDESTNGYYKPDPLPFRELMKASDCLKHRGSIMYHLEDHKDATLADLLDLTITDLETVKNTTKEFDIVSEQVQYKYENKDSLSLWERLKLKGAIIKQNKSSQYFERNFLHKQGLHEREWFKHVIYASGRFTGYEGQVFPMLQEAIEDNDFERFVVGLGVLSKTLRRINRELD